MECNIYDETENLVFSDKKIQDIIEIVLSSEGLNKDSMVSVHIVNDEKMRQYNKEYRGKNSTTDVLSFATKEGIQIKQKDKNDLGDIFISLPQVIKQAKEQEIDQKQEFTRMLVHGTLHLIGYDHQEDDEAETMFNKQEEIIKKIG